MTRYRALVVQRSPYTLRQVSPSLVVVTDYGKRGPRTVIGRLSEESAQSLIYAAYRDAWTGSYTEP